MLKTDFPYFKQKNDYYCGPACLQMILKFRGIKRAQSTIARRAKTSEKYGTPNDSLIKILKYYKIPFRKKNSCNLKEIKTAINRDNPVLVNFIEPVTDDFHFGIAVGYDKNHLIINDPINGRHFKISNNDFLKRWRGSEKNSQRWMLIIERS